MAASLRRGGLLRGEDYRGYAGQLASGALRKGEEVVVLPGGRRTRIAAIDTFDGELEEAVAPMSLTLRLEDELDVSRGELICRAEQAPTVARELQADVCWLNDRPLRPGGRYVIKHTTRNATAVVEELYDCVDVHTLERSDGPRSWRSTTSAGCACARARRWLRPLQGQPPHRQLHPDRRGEQRDGRGRAGRPRRATEVLGEASEPTLIARTQGRTSLESSRFRFFHEELRR